MDDSTTPDSYVAIQPHDATDVHSNVAEEDAYTPESTAQLLKSDRKVKVAGIDCDGVLRGKIMSKDKFLSSLEHGFGMSSAIFGWDMHDVMYTTEVCLTSSKDGYGDLTAKIDLRSFRRLPFEDNIPFFLLHFSIADKPVMADGRSMIEATNQIMAKGGAMGLAGGKFFKQNICYAALA